MNAHNLRSMFSRRNFAPLTISVLFLVVIICGFGRHNAVVREGGSGRSNFQIPPGLRGPMARPNERVHDDDVKVTEEKPRGKWAFTPTFDMSQLKEPSLPAICQRHSNVKRMREVPGGSENKKGGADQ